MPDRSYIPCPTVDRDDEFHIFFSELIEKILLQPIAIMDTMRETIRYETPDFCQESHKDSSTRDSIDIIVSEDDDAFLFLTGFEDTLHCLLHIRQEEGIMEIRESRFEKKPLIFWSDFSIVPEYLRER